MQLEPISLGRTCAAKFQACRSLYLKLNPHGTTDRLREALFFKRSAELFPRHLFDWQVTPPKAVIAYLESDFRGVFERADMIVAADGVVNHRWLHTEHPHEFEATNGAISEADIDAQYPAVRAKFEHLAGKFRRHLQTSGPFFYIVGAAVEPDQASRLVRLLGRSPDHQFQILFAHPDDGTDLAGIDSRIVEAILPDFADEACGNGWEGDPDAWTRVLAPYDLGLPRGPRFNANLNPIPDIDPASLKSASLHWKTPPAWSPVEPLPQDFTIPPVAWDYAVLSAQVDSLAQDRERTLYVSLEMLQGRAGVGLIRADGSGAVGVEYCVDASEGLMHLPLHLRPGMGPASIALRNYGEDGVTSLARLYAVRVSD